MKKMKLLLSILILLLELCLTQEGCWEMVPYKRYSESFLVRVKTVGKCIAHCFDLNQIGQNCSVVTTRGQYCLRQNPDSVVSKSKLIATYSLDAYFLNDQCEEHNCWEMKSIPTNITKVPSDNENYCKRACLETPGCVSMSWYDGACELFSEFEEIWSLKENCKNSSCWVRQPDTQLTEGVTLNGFSLSQCRLRCLETIPCAAFSYDTPAVQCRIYSGLYNVSYPTTPSNGSVLYSLKEICV